MKNALIGKKVYAVTNAGSAPSEDFATSIGEIVKVEDTQFGNFATVIWHEGECEGSFEPFKVHTLKDAGDGMKGIGVYVA